MGARPPEKTPIQNHVNPINPILDDYIPEWWYKVPLKHAYTLLKYTEVTNGTTNTNQYTYSTFIYTTCSTLFTVAEKHTHFRKLALYICICFISVCCYEDTNI